MRQLALISAGVSLLGVVLFSNGLASPSSANGALIADVLILGALLLRWPVTESLRLS